MKNKLLVIDENPEYTRTLRDAVEESSVFEIVGIANNGTDGMHLLLSSKPDIVLMDLMLTGLDGLSILKQMRKMNRRPLVICQSSFCSELCVETARRNGADYFIFKPSSITSVMTVLLEVFDLLNSTTFDRSETAPINRNAVRAIMDSLGFSPRYQGCGYLVESVLHVLESPSSFRNISTGLYADLSLKLHVPKSNIERNIRTAIAAANIDGRLSGKIGRTPTNKNCIQYIMNQYLSQGDS